jgi:hypothetical protein
MRATLLRLDQTGMKVHESWQSSDLGYRLLARVLKEGVQFWYNDTLTVFLFNVARENYTNDMHTIQIQKLYKLRMAGTPQQLKPITAGPFNI